MFFWARGLGAEKRYLAWYTFGMPFNSEQPSEAHLKIGLWFVTHKTQLVAAITTVLIVLVVGFGGYAIYGFAKLYLVEFGSYRRAVNEAPISLVNPDAVAAPQSLGVGTVQSFQAGNGKVDALATLRNNNLQYGATFRYRFVADGVAGAYEDGFILPAEEKYIVTLGIAAADRLRNARLEIIDIAWRRFDSHLASDYTTYRRDRLAIETEDLSFTLGRSGTPSRAEFTAKNAGAYGYWNVRFIVLLMRSGQIVAVNTIEADNIESGAIRPLGVAWFESLPATASVLVLPEVNILDQGVFMPANN